MYSYIWHLSHFFVISKQENAVIQRKRNWLRMGPGMGGAAEMRACRILWNERRCFHACRKRRWSDRRQSSDGWTDVTPCCARQTLLSAGKPSVGASLFNVHSSLFMLLLLLQATKMTMTHVGCYPWPHVSRGGQSQRCAGRIEACALPFG